MKLLISFLAIMLLLSGCSLSNGTHSKTSESTHNPTATEILAEDPEADIIQLKGIIYTNANQIEWVQQTKIKVAESIGTIQKQYRKGDAFENEMATKLPVGVKIYGSGAILIVYYKGEEIRYLGLIEG